MNVKDALHLKPFVFAAVAFSGHALASDFVIGAANSVNDPLQTIKSAADLGIKSIRLDIPWAQVEQEKGQYKIPAPIHQKIEAMRGANIEPLLVFGYGNKIYGGAKPTTPEGRQAFLAYATAVVKILKGQVKYYEIWNEWETKVGGTERGDPGDLVALEKLVCPAIKKIDPSITTIGGGLSSDAFRRAWVDDYAKLGGSRACDAFGMHPYSYQFKRDRGPEMSLNRIRDLRAKFSSDGGKLPDIYITEMGYPVYAGFGGVADKRASAYLTRFYTLAAAQPWIKGVWWYTLRDQGSDPSNKEHHFGLYTANMTLKPSGQAMKEIAAVLNNAASRPTVSQVDGQYEANVSGPQGSSRIGWKFASKSSMVSAVLSRLKIEDPDGDDDDTPVIQKK